MSKHLRKRRFVDRDVQGRLVLAALRYWTMSVLIVAGLSLVGWVFVYPGIGAFLSGSSPGANYLPMFATALGAAVLMVPVAVIDLIRLSHRFAGPMVRLRRSLAILSQGGDPGPLEFRNGDFWKELASEYNEVRNYVLELRTTASSQSTKQPEDYRKTVAAAANLSTCSSDAT
jgi:hypothetical protein